MDHRNLVIKLSSLALTQADGSINKKQLKAIAKDIATLKNDYKFNIVVVSSGAINAGKRQLENIKAEDRKNISYLQACAAIGQPILIHHIQKEFKKYNIDCAQLLVTHEDLKSKKRAHNIRGTLTHVVQSGIIPIINENDGVSFDEITVGDNDQLSAMISSLLGFKTLLMLSSPNGLFESDPGVDKSAKHISLIQFDDDFKELKLITKSSAGRGGMKTKLQAIRKLTPLGHNIILSSFKNKSPIISPLTEDNGSLFLGAKSTGDTKKLSWLLTQVKDGRGVKIDEGAFKALKKNSSLLPVGIKSTIGKFNRGDCIEIIFKNKVVAIGLSEYSQKEIEKMKGLKSKEVTELFPQYPSKVVIHKNNLMTKKV